VEQDKYNMPKFPTYESNQNVQVQPVAPESHGMADKAFAPINNIEDTLAAIGQKLSDANDVMQETKAKTRTEMALAKQEQDAANDPNPDNLELHLKALQEIQKNSTSGIDNQMVAGHVAEEVEQSTLLSGIKIQGIFKEKQMLDAKENQQQANVVAAQNIANPVSEAAAQNDYLNNMNQIRKLHAVGVYNSSAEALAAEKEFKTEIVKAKISQNNSTNTDDYKDIDKGMGLDIKESSEMQKMIAAHIKQVNESNIANTFNGRVSILKGIASKQVDWKSGDKIKQIAAKDPALGSALQMVFNAQANDKTDYEPTSKEGQEYADSVNELLSGMTVKQVNDYLPKAIEQITKLPAGEMQSRLAVLVNASEDRAKSLPIRDEQEIPPEVIKQEGGIQAVIRWNKEHGENDPQTINDYLKDVHSGKSPMEAYNNAIKTKIVKDHPEVAVQKDVPNRIIGNDSKSFHIFTVETKIYPARIWNEKLGRFEINPNREQSNDNGTQQKDK